jgi:hypothetical protein
VVVDALLERNESMCDYDECVLLAVDEKSPATNLSMAVFILLRLLQ